LSKNTATILGIVVAATIPAVVLALFTDVSSGEQDALQQLVVAPYLFLFSAPATLLLGFPTFLLFRRYGLVRWWSALAAGATIGIVVVIVLALPSAPGLRQLTIYGLTGAASGFAFWLIWRAGGNNRKHPRET